MRMEECRHGNKAPLDMLLALPESQGGLGRHKCPNCEITGVKITGVRYKLNVMLAPL